MADMVAAPVRRTELDVALYLLPLAFGAYSSMAVQAGIFTVVYISSVQQGIHLAVGHYRFAQPAASRIAASMTASSCTPRPSSEKPTTSSRMAAISDSSPPPFCRMVMVP